MKLTISFIGILFLCNGVIAQTLNLSISNPQPRLGQSFTLSINIDTLNEKLFHFLSNAFNVSLVAGSPGVSVNLEGKKIERDEIGPLTIEFNGIKYTTNKIEFDIIDSLPAVNKGYWIRKLKVNDSTVFVLTEQRIPALKYYDDPIDSIKMSIKTPDNEKEAELIWLAAEVANAKVNMSGGYSAIQSIYLPCSELNFEYCLWVYTIIIIDKNKPVVLQKKDFTNLPEYYKFENIAVN
jgi:hypothetical protein